MGADTMVMPPVMQKVGASLQTGAIGGKYHWLPNPDSVHLKTAPPPGNPLARSSSFCEAPVPHSTQGLFSTDIPGSGDSGGGTDGGSSAINMDAGSDLGTTEANNASFNFLVHDMLSARTASGGGNSISHTRSQDNGPNDSSSGDADTYAVWQALLQEMHAPQDDTNTNSSCHVGLAPNTTCE